MAKRLEALVAQGRRVRRPREQREVAFGLADLSTKAEAHERIVKKGGIKTLVGLLHSTDMDAQRFAALAVANVASAEVNRMIICKDLESGALQNLTEFIERGKGDAFGRQYCAMAIGNIAADPNSHDDIVELGGIKALVSLLSRSISATTHCSTEDSTNDVDIDGGRCAAFALSNLAANSNYRQQIVDEGAITPLVSLACCDDVNAQRHALAALRGICIEPKCRIGVVQLGIIDPLILISRSDDMDMLREVAGAFNCLSCMEQNKEEICDRAISTIITLLLSGDSEIERHACCAVANLLEVIGVHDRFLEEKGLLPLISLSVSKDLVCKGEASRAIANLAANTKIQMLLVREGILDSMVDALGKDEVNCQRFAALCIANLSTTVASQMQVVEAGAITPLITLAANVNNQLEARRYAILALANLSATVANHAVILREDGLQALFSLANSSDAMSLYYVGSALSNLSSNLSNHHSIVEEGGLQPLLTLSYHKDPDVHMKAAAAIRGLSVTEDIRMKIVQEGGLEPLTRLLTSKDVEILRETTAAFCNLSLSDENKFEIAKCGAIAPLICHLQDDDMFIASQSSACLANLAELSDNQDAVAMEGGIRPCISVMRSRYIEVQRESGRLLANLCASSTSASIDSIVDSGGHQLLISFLLSEDTACQRVGGFGVGNLCTHDKHRVTLMKAGVLEPLCSLARLEDIAVEIQRFAVLAIANLASSIETHQDFLDEDVLPLLISLSSARDAEVRQYAAFAVTKLSANANVRDAVTEEGGVEPVLYLARTDNVDVRTEILPALANLSFSVVNKVEICNNGGLHAIVDVIVNVGGKLSLENSRMACCAIANLAEAVENMESIVNANVISLLLKFVYVNYPAVHREIARAVGNLAINIEYGTTILEEGFLPFLIKSLGSNELECCRMSAMALGNLASNSRNHEKLLKGGIMPNLVVVCKAAVEKSKKFDHETAQYCLLALANISVSPEVHSQIMSELLDVLDEFSKHRDVKCRHYAIFVLGNLCSNIEMLESIFDRGFLKSFFDDAFSSNTEASTNAQFQAVSSIRGLGTHKVLRTTVLKKGALEPLMLICSTSDKDMDIEVQREATAAICNFALSDENKMPLSRAGVIPALLKVAQRDDVICQFFSIATIANLAEMDSNIQRRMFDDGCLQSLFKLGEKSDLSIEVRCEVIRCYALFTCFRECHPYLMKDNILSQIRNFASYEESTNCLTFAAVAIGNLAVEVENHDKLFASGVISSLMNLTKTMDTKIRHCVAYCFHNISLVESNSSKCEEMVVMSALGQLISIDEDKDETMLLASIAIRNLSKSKYSRLQFVDCGGLPHLLRLAKVENTELKREVAGSLRHLTLCDTNKSIIVTISDGFDVLLSLCHAKDEKVAHQACGAIANVAEDARAQAIMIKAGFLQHLKFTLSSASIEIRREILRAIANLSSNLSFAQTIAEGGALVPFAAGIASNDLLCQRYASMGIRNLATYDENHPRIWKEVDFDQVFNLAKINEKKSPHELVTKQNIICLLANLAFVGSNHVQLMERGIASLVVSLLDNFDDSLRSSAFVCVANLVASPVNHQSILDEDCLEFIISFLSSKNEELISLSVDILRGLSSSDFSRPLIMKAHAINPLLKLSKTSDVDLQREVMATLCNMSLAGCIGEDPGRFLAEIDTTDLVSFLCSSDRTQSLFGAVTLGNIASECALRSPMVGCGALGPLINVSEVANKETKRCIAYALCNLAADESNRAIIVRSGGLRPIFSLCFAPDLNDARAGLATVRGIATLSDLRRPAVEAGFVRIVAENIETIILDAQSRIEACSALFLLSLNEENREDMIRHNALEVLRKLAQKLDSASCQLSICTVANFAEHNKFHEKIVTVWDAGTLFDFGDTTNASVVRGILRCVTNLSANSETHRQLVDAKACDLISGFCNFSDSLSSSFASLSLSNFLQSPSLCFPMERIVSAVCNLAKYSALEEYIEAGQIDLGRRYACLALCTLCSNHKNHLAILENKGITALVENLGGGDSEARLYASFAISRLADNPMMVKEIGEESKVFDSLLALISGEYHNSILYSSAALRKLSSLNENRIAIIGADTTLNALTKAALFDKLDVQREVSACLCHMCLSDKKKTLIARSCVMPPLATLAQCTDEEVSRFSIGAFANLAEDESTHKILIGDMNMLHIFVSLMKDKRLTIHREACRAISNLLSSDYSHSKFFEEGCLRGLCKVLKSADAECQYNAGLSFHKLSARSANHDSLILKFVLQSLAASVNNTSGSIQARYLVGASLRDLSANARHKELFAREGGLKAAVSLCDSEDLKLQIFAVGILKHLSLSPQLKFKLVESGSLQSVFEFAKSRDDATLLRECASTLANVAECEDIQLALVEIGALTSFSILAEKTDTHIRRNIARAFCSISSHPKNTTGIFGRSEIRALVSLFSNPDDEQCLGDVASALSNLSIAKENHNLILKEHGLRPLLKLLSSSLEYCQISACRVLHRLALSETGRNRIRKEEYGPEELVAISQSSNNDVSRFALMSICNLMLDEAYQIIFSKLNCIPALISVLQQSTIECKKLALMTICNMTANYSNKLFVLKSGTLPHILQEMSSIDYSCKLYATMAFSNLASNDVTRKLMVDSQCIARLTETAFAETEKVELYRAGALALYNLAAEATSHIPMVKDGIPERLLTLCRSPDVECRRCALMTLCTLSSNPLTRIEVTKGGGLQTALILLADDDIECQRYACIYVANLANDANTQRQVVVHGGLRRLVELSKSKDEHNRRYSIMALANIAACDENHKPMRKQGVYDILIDSAKKGENDMKESCAFGLANFISSRAAMQSTCNSDIVCLLNHVVKSIYAHSQTLALSSLRTLAARPENCDLFIANGILTSLNYAGGCDVVEVQRELAACLCNLSASSHKLIITDRCIRTLLSLAKTADEEALRQSMGALANLCEDVTTHSIFAASHALRSVIDCLCHEKIDVHREASRAVSNLVTSCCFHGAILEFGMIQLLHLCSSEDKECLYHVALSLRKLAPAKKAFHQLIMQHSLSNLLSKIKVVDMITKVHVAAVMREVASNDAHKVEFAEMGGIDVVVSLSRAKDMELQIIAISILRHLALRDCLQQIIIEKGALPPCIRCVSKATEDLKCQVAGLIANLSECSETQTVMVDQGAVPALVTLHRYDNCEVRQDCARALANLCSREMNHLPIYRQGGLSALIKLSQHDEDICQRYVATALRFLATDPEVRSAIASEEAIDSFMLLASHSLIGYQRAAAASFASMSLSEECRGALVEKGGLQVCLRLLQREDPYVQQHAMFTVANISDAHTTHKMILNEGTLPLLIQLGEMNDVKIQRDISRAFSSLSSNEDSKIPLIESGILPLLIKLTRSADVATQRYVALTLCNLSQSTEKSRIVDNGVLRSLVFLARYPDMDIERYAALTFANLALGGHGKNKQLIVKEGSVKPLIEMSKFPDGEMQHCAALALNSIALGTFNESKVEIMQMNGLEPIVDFFQTNDADRIHLAAYLFGSLSENEEVKESLVELGVTSKLVKEAAKGSIEIKRTVCYYLALLAENTTFHKSLEEEGGFEALISLSSLTDVECQDYGAFALAFLASNKAYQVKLVKLGAVRPLVSMMATEAEPRHYAGLALLKLADNFENHVTIAEEGGIQALLKMGRNRSTDEGLSYKTALTVGHLASNAVKSLPSGGLHFGDGPIGFASGSLRDRSGMGSLSTTDPSS
eukprot:CAMPEP_0116018954 /NCGR_PEP_ID=MMETSP0321-20121206/8948_1 /TAXON_ID=163516 /ORGANISM="Leptocylindrus danicus var. danicus, Strain B650" /LENGTH=3722 /DNA_ID=CAMNT_0003489431 /DNA_START=23 /DNA_END=11192 /DNA_ORIENTATION=-